MLTFSNMFVDDLMADLLKLLLDVTVMWFCSLNRGYMHRTRRDEKGEYYMLVLFATLGMMVMIPPAISDGLSLGLELLSLSLYTPWWR